MSHFSTDITESRQALLGLNLCCLIQPKYLADQNAGQHTPVNY